jgi:cytochrome c-type biogenesis protein CcmH/NrfG
MEIFQKNVSEHPESLNVYDSLSEALATKNKAAMAITNYSKALEMAPETQKGRIESVLVGLA